MLRPIVTTVLDVAGVLLLAACAYLVFPPAALAVLGVGCLVASYQKAGCTLVVDEADLRPEDEVR